MLDLLPDTTVPVSGPALAPLVFSTDGVDPRHRLDLWRGTYESFNRILLPDTAGDGFAARNEIWPLGDLAVMRNAAPAMAFARTPRHVRRDGVDHWVIRVARTGSGRFRFGDHCFDAAPMQPVLFSLGDPSDSDRTAADWVSLYIPRDGFPELSAGFAALGNGPLRGPGAQLLAETLFALKCRLPEVTRVQAPLLAEAMRAMVSACLLADVVPRRVSPADVAVAQRERIRRVIREHIASPTLGPAKICRLAGISRSQLYRLFEPHGGVARYIQAQRLRLAHAALAGAGAAVPVAAVAERLGFFDASAFSRAFRGAYGCTPSEVRGAPPASRSRAEDALSELGGAVDFGGVLRRLGAMPRAA